MLESWRHTPLQYILYPEQEMPTDKTHFVAARTNLNPNGQQYEPAGYFIRWRRPAAAVTNLFEVAEVML